MANKKPVKTAPVSLVKEAHKLLPSARIDCNSHYIFWGIPITNFWDNQLPKNGKLAFTNKVNDICYARLKGKILKARVLVNQHKRDVFKDKEKEAILFDWFDFITKRSHFKDAFLNARRRNEWLRDGLALNCDKCSSFVMAAITSLREGWEFPTQIFAWDEFKKKGFDEHEAYVMSLYFRKEGDKLVYEVQGGGHRTIDARALTFKRAKAFIKGEIEWEGKPIKEGCVSWKVNTTIQPVSTAHYRPGDISELLEKKKKYIGEGWERREVVEMTDDLINTLKEKLRA